MTDVKDFLWGEWKRTCLLSVDADNSTIKEWFNVICGFYDESHRFYHNLNHIDSCLKLLRKFEHSSLTPEETCYNIIPVQIAIWFHDIIYNPQESNNEERSADIAKAFISSAKPFLRSTKSLVENLILLTKHQNINYKLIPEEKLILDIDLSILGSSSKEFDVYENNIRKEYWFVPEALYNKARLKFIVSILNRNRIFQTDFFYNLFENKAKINLDKSRITLREKLGLND